MSSPTKGSVSYWLMRHLAGSVAGAACGSLVLALVLVAPSYFLFASLIDRPGLLDMAGGIAIVWAASAPAFLGGLLLLAAPARWLLERWGRTGPADAAGAGAVTLAAGSFLGMMVSSWLTVGAGPNPLFTSFFVCVFGASGAAAAVIYRNVVLQHD